MIRRSFIYIFTVLTLSINISFVYAMGELHPHEYFPLKVLVVKDTDSITLSIKGDYKIVDYATKDILEQGERLQRREVTVSDIDSEGIRVLSGERTCIYINKRQFRGNLDIIKNKEKNGIFVVNHIDIEEYLCGVLYHEVSHRWPIEVLKAQAIAARTYALYQKLVSKNKYYDMTADVYSQVYGGRTSETWRTTKAVNLTLGQVLMYKGKVFPSYYHATCGGSTTDAATIWGIDIPVLRGRKCDFCKDSPHYNWRKEFRIDYIRDKLRDAGYKIELTSFEILKRDGSGRVVEIRLIGKDSSIKLTGNKFRLAVGSNAIKSTNFEILTRGSFVTFQGKGWGHGVGMCQWGAYYLARKGWKAEEILEYYYPGAEIVVAE